MDDPIQMDDLGYIPQGICPQNPATLESVVFIGQKCNSARIGLKEFCV